MNQLAINYNPLIQGGQQAGQMSGQGANMLMGQANQLAGAGTNILNTAFDPQQALYDRTLGQMTNQVNAQQALRGLGNSPVGGSEMNQALGNFNIDWQNAQLARQLQGIQGAGQANQIVGADLSAAPGMALQAGQYPVQGQQAAYQAPATAAANYATQLGQSLAPLQNLQPNAQNYMGLGASAGYNNYKAANEQNQQGLQAVLTGLNGLSNSRAGSWLSQTFSNPTGSTPATGYGYGEPATWGVNAWGP